MTMLFQFFWFLIAAVWLVNVMTAIRPRLRELEADGRLSSDEVGTAMFWSAVPLTVMFVAFGVIQLVAGWASPLCLYTLDWSNWAVTATWALNLTAIGLLVGWLQFGSGAETVSQIGPAFGLKASPAVVKWGGTAVLIAIVVSTFLMVEPGQYAGMC